MYTLAFRTGCAQALLIITFKLSETCTFCIQHSYVNTILMFYIYLSHINCHSRVLKKVAHSCSLESDLIIPDATLSTPNYPPHMRTCITRRAYFLSNTYDNRQKIHLLAKPFPMHITPTLGVSTWLCAKYCLSLTHVHSRDTKKGSVIIKFLTFESPPADPALNLQHNRPWLYQISNDRGA